MRNGLCFFLLLMTSFCLGNDCEGVYFLGTQKFIEPRIESLDISELDSSLVIPVCVNMSDSTIIMEKNVEKYSYWLSKKSSICCNPQISVSHYESFVSKYMDRRKTHCNNRYESLGNGVTTSTNCTIVSKLDSTEDYRNATHCGYPVRYDISVENDELKNIPVSLACMSTFPHNIIGKVFAHEKSVYVFCDGFYTNLRTNFYVKVTGICSDKK
ncbi:MAG: hypothetical protein MJY82_06335 [Fibrobacter sp.]|nr:hypothetical protein [Fibrobacter sp.]